MPTAFRVAMALCISTLFAGIGANAQSLPREVATRAEQANRLIVQVGAPGCHNVDDDETHPLKQVAADRQLIVEVFPPGHRRASRLPNRHVIVEIGGGTGALSQSNVPDLAPCRI